MLNILRVTHTALNHKLFTWYFINKHTLKIYHIKFMYINIFLSYVPEGQKYFDSCYV